MISENPKSHAQGNVTPWDDDKKIKNMFKDLLQRGCKRELLPTDLASKTIYIILQRVTVKSAGHATERFIGDTPGLEDMGWMLWVLVDTMARVDQRHHDGLVDFINAFWPLLQTQPWVLWNIPIQNSPFVLGPVFRESFQGAGSGAYVPPNCPGSTDEEQRVHSWCNYCLFVARMTCDTEQDFSLYLLWFARDALEDCSWNVCQYPDAAVLALERVIDTCGVQMYQMDRDFGRSGSGGDGKRSWEGKSGFCKERWLFWEKGLLEIAQDVAQYPAPVRDSACRTASKMQSIRTGDTHSTG